MKKIKVNTSSKPYEIFIGRNIFTNVIDLINKKNLYENLFIIVDKNVFIHHKNLIENTFDNFKRKYFYIFTSTEKNKNLEEVKNIFNLLIKKSYGRDTTIVAIGGGILGDLAAFVASSFGRGTKFIQIPTTLLSMVDSSVGGKTGINFGDTKNLIGTFFQPDFVLIDTLFLSTLPNDELLCGLGEVAKYYFLTGDNFYKSTLNKVLNNNINDIEKLIAKSISFKTNVVENDEREIGLRKILNLGHTFGHAIEIDQNHKIKHGQAVIIGITCSLYLSFYLELINHKDLNSLLKLPLLFQNLISINNANIESIYKIMLRDKKNRNGKIKFVLVKEPGHIFIDVEAEKILIVKSLEKGLSLFI
ncbi:MAG: 3-dehydroquinate synthase [Melioribacteraceae bacterium]|nr:3-dehydroquinate synthase [Melioribacteraceae bacterium]